MSTASDAHPSEVHSQSPLMVPMGSRNVLLAVRRSQSRSAHATYLRERGFRVQIADHGLDCLDIVAHFHPDVVIIEPELLWGGGDGVLAVFSTLPDLCRVPVVVLTTDFNRASIYSISQFNVCDFWVQPITPQRLTARIENLMNADLLPIGVGRLTQLDHAEGDVGSDRTGLGSIRTG